MRIFESNGKLLDLDCVVAVQAFGKNKLHIYLVHSEPLKIVFSNDDEPKGRDELYDQILGAMRYL